MAFITLIGTGIILIMLGVATICTTCIAVAGDPSWWHAVAVITVIGCSIGV
ncbi:hypothetical protein [Geobacter sp. OR-1]|uniref:hypothetical protein n=1 Tax=Geobacter sp. OR-1 TaxID=1266765 RepID=UPI001ED9C1B0|nr:hypothetical protein [Geobacter sp. OR-1]